MPNKASEPNLFNQQRVRSPDSQTAAVQMNAILASELINKQQQHSTWQILAARRGPLVLSCLKSIFEAGQPDAPLIRLPHLDTGTDDVSIITAHMARFEAPNLRLRVLQRPASKSLSPHQFQNNDRRC